MDTADDLTYLNYLGDKNDAFLLQNTDEGLGVQDPTLNSHTIFGELDDGARIWTIDSLPVLLNGSVITEDQSGEPQINLEAPKIILSELGQNDVISDACTENNENISYPVEIPGEGFITSNGLFLANEVLLQMNLQNEIHTTVEQTHNINIENNNDAEVFLNGDKSLYKVKSKLPENYFHADSTDNKSDKVINLNHLSASTDVIQLLNTDGTIINIDKNVLINSKSNGMQGNDRAPINENFERITAYKCKKCGYLSETLIDISKHVNSRVCEKTSEPIISDSIKPRMKSVLNGTDARNKQKLVLLCSECNQGYSTTTDLRNHMIMAHHLISGQNKTKDQNDSNNYKESTSDSRKQEYLSIIKSQQKASRKVKCSIKGCESRFALDEYRIRHEKCHVNSQKNQFKCPACDKMFSIWRVCSLHLWKCHEIDVGLLSCVVCNYKTSSPHKLWPHMLIHDEKRQYLCSECGKSFKQLTQLRNHQVLHMARGEGAPKWITQQKCDTCGNIFSDSKSLKKHIQCVHNKFKPYVCNICGHKTARKAMLELHLRQHTGEKPYICQLCPYRTGDHNSLRRHLMRHSGGKKYSCPHCDYQSIQSVAFKHHILIKHPGAEGIFRCTQCNFDTVNENVYMTHVKQHQNNLINGSKEQEKNNESEVNNPSEESVSNENVIKNETKPEEDEETQHGFLTSMNNEDTVDRGGITIPAGLELQI